MDNIFNFKIIDSIVDINNDNCDVEITFEGKRFMATFFTIDNIKSIMEGYRSTGECLSGTYFSASDMIIVKNLSESTIYSTINDLVENGDLEKVFEKL